MTMVSGLFFVRLVPRFHPSWVIAAGMFFNALAYGTVFILGSDSHLTLLVAFLVMGLGTGASETLANDAMLSSVPASKAGAASAISETSYELGAVLGTAVLGGILTAAYRAHIDLPAGLSPEQAATAHETLGGATAVTASLDPELGAQVLAGAQEAFDSGVIWTTGISAILMLIAAVLVLRMLRTADPQASAADH